MGGPLNFMEYGLIELVGLADVGLSANLSGCSLASN
jgi:hypothetical protein